jgi:hypothetical protein
VDLFRKKHPFKNTNDNSNNNSDNKPQNMDRAEQKRPSRGFKNYDKTNKTCTTKNYLETYFLAGYVILLRISKEH